MLFVLRSVCVEDGVVVVGILGEESKSQWMKESNRHSTIQPVLLPTPFIPGGSSNLKLAEPQFQKFYPRTL